MQNTQLSPWLLKNKVPVSTYCVWDQLIFFLQRFLSGKTNNHNWHFEPDLWIKIPFWNLWILVCVWEREGRNEKNRQRKPNTYYTITLKMQAVFCLAKIKIPLCKIFLCPEESTKVMTSLWSRSHGWKWRGLKSHGNNELNALRDCVHNGGDLEMLTDYVSFVKDLVVVIIKLY